MAEESTTPDETQELTDGFNLLIDALKLNDLNTIYGVPGIPITDFGRMAQASGIRVLSSPQLTLRSAPCTFPRASAYLPAYFVN